jgi:polysaccharide biosynthesis protein PslH
MEARRILILTNRIPYPLKDGGALAMDAMIHGYQEAGWQVYLLAMNTSRHHLPQEKIKQLYPDIYCFETVDVDNDIRWLPTLKNFFFSTQPEHADRFTDDLFRDKLLDVIKTFNPSVIQMESIYLSVYLQDIKKLSKAPLVQRLHNIEYQIWERLANETTQPVKRFYLKNLAKRIRRFEIQIWSQFDLLLPITQEDETIIRASGCRTPQLATPFGINVKRTPNEPAQQNWTGYHIAAMDWLPNQEAMDWLLQDIWPLIHEAVPAFQFYFAGRSMPARFFENLPGGVQCLGEVDNADQFIADKKILLVPLRAGGGIRVKILEAMAAGKLVISTSVGMQGISIEPGVHYLQANTPEQFAESIKWALQNRESAEKIAENAKHLINGNYNQKNIMDNLLNELSLLAERNNE